MIHVACAANNAYFRHAATMLASAIAFNPGLRAYVLCMPDVALAEREQLSEWARARGAIIECVVPELELPESLPENRRLTRAAWLRLMLPDLLPKLSRVIYLDVDLIVQDSLEELWSIDLQGNWLAAVTDIPRKVGGMLTYRRVGFADPSHYFNSGVLLMDLDRFRSEQVAARVLRYAVEHPEQVALADQDPLNAVLHEHRLPLPLRWNVLSPLHEGGTSHGFPFTDTEKHDALQRPAVIHYSGLWKPWHHRSKHPLRGLYKTYRRQTPWADWDVEGQTIKHRLLRLLPESMQWWMTHFYWKFRRGLAALTIADGK